MPLYLLGALKLPRRVPEYYGFGDEDKAAVYLAEAAENWLETPDALEWFMEVLARTVSRPPPHKPFALDS